MTEQTPPVRFTRILLIFGATLLVVVLGDLAPRGRHRLPPPPRHFVKQGDPDLGREAISSYGCGACHTIPGIRAAVGRVGPQLQDIRNQIYLGGVVPNGPENMVSWIMDPPKHDPFTAMPNLGVTDQDARNIAAYLFSQP